MESRLLGRLVQSPRAGRGIPSHHDDEDGKVGSWREATQGQGRRGTALSLLYAVREGNPASLHNGVQGMGEGARRDEEGAMRTARSNK